MFNDYYNIFWSWLLEINFTIVWNMLAFYKYWILWCLFELLYCNVLAIHANEYFNRGWDVFSLPIDSIWEDNDGSE